MLLKTALSGDVVMTTSYTEGVEENQLLTPNASVVKSSQYHAVDKGLNGMQCQLINSAACLLTIFPSKAISETTGPCSYDIIG